MPQIPAATLSEMRRSCANDGRLFVSDLSSDPTKALAFDTIELLRDPSHKCALTPDELRELGRALSLWEIVVTSDEASLPLEAVLATSFPPEGMLDRVRSLLARDAASSSDTFGMKAQDRGGAIWVTYPTMIVGWNFD